MLKQVGHFNLRPKDTSLRRSLKDAQQEKYAPGTGMSTVAVFTQTHDADCQQTLRTAWLRRAYLALTLVSWL